ncbi:hypothetical protein EVJ58_g649 [Rhodofomes roseus]|uniref:Ubiquitin-like protease family profile domain-containing protein n=1 Tax=Rhodofomes roseus TaxID=34475 RepID=A0A4Y9Z5H1_9APHY|nr:hypothetical protein EVJ58_g649 [Rhodofomes roseus]
MIASDEDRTNITIYLRHRRVGLYLEAPADASTPQSQPDPHSDAVPARPSAPPPPRRPSRPAIPSEFKPGARPQDSAPTKPPSSSVPRKVSQRVPQAPLVEVQVPPVASSSSIIQPAILPRLRRKSEPSVRDYAALPKPPVQPNPIPPAQPSAGPSAQPRPHTGPGYVNGRRKYVVREHIFAKQHKAKVKETREKDMDEMEKDLYELRRRQGYTGDYASYKSLLRYQARLDRLQNQDPLAALSASASLTDLRHPSSLDNEPITKGFLQRALEKATATLASREQPRPDVPGYERIRVQQRARDEEIERRIRGPKIPPLPASLPAKDDALVDDLLARRGVISKCVREQITDKDLSRLKPNTWLNDEIINFYGQLIMSRAEASKENSGMNGKKKPLNVHYFSSFFWTKLEGDGYEKGRLAKWTKKVDIFSKDVVLIPVNHHNAHWTAAAINFRRKRIESYDSMGMPRQNVFKLLRGYLDAEHRNKKREPFDFSGWKNFVLVDTPQQENGFDCGVFTCQFLESLSRGEEHFAFKQANMSYLRRRMIWEIGNSKLRDGP